MVPAGRVEEEVAAVYPEEATTAAQDQSVPTARFAVSLWQRRASSITHRFAVTVRMA